jgi:hypothetical protein
MIGCQLKFTLLSVVMSCFDVWVNRGSPKAAWMPYTAWIPWMHFAAWMSSAATDMSLSAPARHVACTSLWLRSLWLRSLCDLGSISAGGSERTKATPTVHHWKIVERAESRTICRRFLQIEGCHSIRT